MHYFAYNDNLKREIIRARIGKAEFAGKAVLFGYALCFDSMGYADITESGGAKVFGAIYGVSAEQAGMLAKFEGEPVIGKRKSIEVECEGKKISAFTFERIEKTRQKRPLENYLGQLCDGLIEAGWEKSEIDSAKRVAGYLF
ncbi:MAG: gamma-glutamylcyclotransferase family protein [archaeon]